MELSVVIPCYNASRTLGAQLEALSAQEFAGPWEVIVADNGSTDRTIAVAERYRERVSNLRVIAAGGRRGAAHARNRGVRVARSEWLAFCDADDEVAPGYLQAMAEALSRWSFVVCRYDYEKLNSRWIARCHTPSQVSGVDRGLFGPYAYAGGGGIGVRRTAHDAVGGFDETLTALEDSDYCIRLQRAGFPPRFVEEALVHVRWRSAVFATFQQARCWGRGYVAVRERHCPAEAVQETPRALLSHLLRIRRVRTREDLARWIWATGWRLGSLEGWREHCRKAAVHQNPAVL